MKILFVENRFRTRIWETFADCLINDGHQVLFLVQNHLFHPRCGRVWVIPYPNKTQLEEPTEADRSLILSDRNINYFGHRSTGHYTYYRKQLFAHDLHQLADDQRHRDDDYARDGNERLYVRLTEFREVGADDAYCAGNADNTHHQYRYEINAYLDLTFGL